MIFFQECELIVSLEDSLEMKKRKETISEEKAELESYIEMVKEL